ncbi:MAG: hypothetical protein Q8L92_06555, partial [Rubrivivax sp.]|nr:hypothetical protein [Rubrivivax sp.]
EQLFLDPRFSNPAPLVIGHDHWLCGGGSRSAVERVGRSLVAARTGRTRGGLKASNLATTSR